jgi:predicted dehydrogenase
MSRPVGIGVIGAGTIAQISHIPYILDDEQRFKLLAVSDINESLLTAVADHYHIDARYTDYQALLDREDIEAVVICHSGSHHDSVLAALERGKDILVEKPLAWNLREAQEIAARVEQSGRIVQMGYHKLYDPAFPVAKQQVEKIEDLGYVRIAVLHPVAEFGFSHLRLRRGGGVIQEGHKEPGSWAEQLDGYLQGLSGGARAPLVDEALGERKDNRQLRQLFGTLNGSLIHSIYMMFGFLGEPARVRSVELWRDTMSLQILVEYSPNLCCCLEWHHLPYLKDYREEYSFYGNRSRVSLHFPAPYFLHLPSPIIVQGCDGELTWEKKILVSYDEAYRRELREFHACVLERKQPLAGVMDAVKHTRFIQQVISKAQP